MITKVCIQDNNIWLRTYLQQILNVKVMQTELDSRAQWLSYKKFKTSYFNWLREQNWPRSRRCWIDHGRHALCIEHTRTNKDLWYCDCEFDRDLKETIDINLDILRIKNLECFMISDVFKQQSVDKFVNVKKLVN